MTKKLFGTDGIRGKSNLYPMTADIALKIGMAVAYHITKKQKISTNRVVIGKDTRLSGYLFEQALTAGFVSMGMHVLVVGPMPTPAIALMTRSLRADLGVVVSASHNPYYDNGIKIFNSQGYKISDEDEHEIENLIFNTDIGNLLVPSSKVAKVERIREGTGRYIEYLKRSVPKDIILSKLKVVLDCANGAGYVAAPMLLYELGINNLITIGNHPDGYNINDNCGSIHPEALMERVKAEKADIGIALDGDADRVLIVDETGKLIDGDQIMALFALSLKEENKLEKDTVVATIMSNMGLEVFLKKHGINLVRTKVGDRYVIDHMIEHDLNFGGEQSGHIILRDHNSTGDGILSALHILRLLVKTGKKTSELLSQFQPFPQLLVNVPSHPTINALETDSVKKIIASVEAELKDKGRVVVRKSGTEPIIRIMIEAENMDLVHKYCGLIEQEIRKVK